MADVLVQDIGDGHQGFVPDADIAANLNAVLTTNNDTGNVPIVARDGEIIRASFNLDPAGTVTIRSNDAAGVMASRVVLDVDGSFKWQNADGSVGITVLTDTSVLVNSGDAKFQIATDGSIAIGNGAESGAIEIAANGVISLNGAHALMVDADGAKIDSVLLLSLLGGGSLPTTDPAVAGALWNNAGVVMVSAG